MITTYPTPSKKLLDIGQVAEQLNVKVSHVRRLVFARRIPYRKVGHLVRFRPAEIERWLDESAPSA
jgi:excisionase family DNA binding protein